jgi:predicted nucleotidyltransferase
VSVFEHTDDILDTLRREISRVLGDQVESMLLYGSRARGEHRPDSDIDVLVVTRDAVDYGELIRRTSDVVSTLSLENDVVISRVFVSKERFEREQSPFLLNVRREGVVL